MIVNNQEIEQILCSHCGAKNETVLEFCSFCNARLYEETLPLKDQILSKFVQRRTEFKPAFGHLKNRYFEPPKLWLFQSPGLYVYFRLFLYSSIVLFILVYGSYYVLIQRPIQLENSAFESVMAAYHANEDKTVIEEKITQFISDYPESEYVSKAKVLKEELRTQELNSAINQAEQQNSIQLKLETYEFILKNYQNIPAETKQVLENKSKQYREEINKGKMQLSVGKKHFEREYYTACIRELKPLVAKGESMGNLFTEAKEMMDKAYVKKIQYYLVKGQLKKAKDALEEAKAAKLSSKTLDELAEKIKKLNI